MSAPEVEACPIDGSRRTLLIEGEETFTVCPFCGEVARCG